MPWKPNHTCTFPGCTRRIPSGRSLCDEHAAARRDMYEARRGTSTQRGYDARWRKLRAIYIHDHPLCAACAAEGKLRAAAVVDHITPHRGDISLLYDESNLQSLCTECHNRKTAAEDGAFGNRRVANAES